MGLFSRNQSSADEAEEILERVELPNREDINEEYLSNSDENRHFEIKPTPPERSLTYSIEDAIKLMQSLPQDNQETVVTVVMKTLESTHIKIKDILDDAERKETLIHQQQEKLEREIKQLQAKISERNQRIDTLKEDLQTTVSVRRRLQLALELENKAAPRNGSDGAKPIKHTAPGATREAKAHTAKAAVTEPAKNSHHSPTSSAGKGPNPQASN